ncbi:MAG: PRTRC system ThiF family protein, partial [Candidatus Sulfotelmatobacter sp.]
LLVGAGGSGSAVLLQLPFLEQALRAWGQPGLSVTVTDPDTVSEVNVVRQPFSHVDIGSNKAICLVGRINMFWGFGWKAIPHAFGDGPAAQRECDLLISCVDTRKARHQIAESFKKFRAPAYHLDLGNNASSGQYVLGQRRWRSLHCKFLQDFGECSEGMNNVKMNLDAVGDRASIALLTSSYMATSSELINSAPSCRTVLAEIRKAISFIYAPHFKATFKATGKCGRAISRYDVRLLSSAPNSSMVRFQHATLCARQSGYKEMIFY